MKWFYRVFLILIAFAAVLPILFPLLGYEFEYTSVSAVAVFFAAVSGVSIIMNIKTKFSETGILYALLAPFSVIYAVFIGFQTVFSFVCVLLCVAGCVYAAEKNGRPIALKITCIAFSAVVMFFVVFGGIIILTFGEFVSTSVVRSVESPSGAYCADIIDRNEGALGGSTRVEVRENKKTDAVLFKFSKSPERVYFGDWGEFKNMELYWKDDRHLVINSKEYSLK